MPNTKPFVTVATFCEKVLHESDGVMSAVRIVDTFIVTGPKVVPLDASPVVAVTGLICLKSGDLTGSFTVGLVLENTKGERTVVSPEGGWPVVFKGGEHGIQIKLDFMLEIKNLGLVWFDVMFGEEVLTRIPLRLRSVEPASEQTRNSKTT
jgi:hypothetical protein